VAALQLCGQYSEEEAREKLGFGSVGAMRQQLKSWNIPDWLVGDTPADEERGRKRRAEGRRQSEGETIALPPPSDAAMLFMKGLRELQERAENLWRREEYLKEGRFVAGGTARGAIVYRRESMPADEWQFCCQMYGKDPDTTDVFKIPHEFNVPLGGESSPPAGLPALIAAYVLAGEPIQPLIENLHPNPSSIDAERLERAIEKLNLSTNQLARLVRGGKVKRGPLPEGVPPAEHGAARDIQKLREQGKTDKDILEHLRLNPSLSDLTQEDVRRLGNLRLP
jgi:hypothetical protein